MFLGVFFTKMRAARILRAYSCKVFHARQARRHTHLYIYIFKFGPSQLPVSTALMTDGHNVLLNLFYNASMQY